MPDDEWDSIENANGQFRWVWNGPTGEQRIGPDLHKTHGAAIRAGKSWFARKNAR